MVKLKGLESVLVTVKTVDSEPGAREICGRQETGRDQGGPAGEHNDPERRETAAACGRGSEDPKQHAH